MNWVAEAPGDSYYSFPSPHTMGDGQDTGISNTSTASSSEQQLHARLQPQPHPSSQPNPLDRRSKSRVSTGAAQGWERAGSSLARPSRMHPDNGGFAAAPYRNDLGLPTSSSASPSVPSSMCAYQGVGQRTLSADPFRSFPFSDGDPSSLLFPDHRLNTPASYPDHHSTSTLYNNLVYPTTTQDQLSFTPQPAAPSRRTSRPDFGTSSFLPPANPTFDRPLYQHQSAAALRRGSLPAHLGQSLPSDVTAPSGHNASMGRAPRAVDVPARPRSSTSTSSSAPSSFMPSGRRLRTLLSDADMRAGLQPNVHHAAAPAFDVGFHPSVQAVPQRLLNKQRSSVDSFGRLSGSSSKRRSPLVRSVSDYAPSSSSSYAPVAVSSSEPSPFGLQGERLSGSLQSASVRSPPPGTSAFLYAHAGTPSNPVSPARSCFPLAEEGPTTASLIEVESRVPILTDWDELVSHDEQWRHRELQHQRSSLSSATSSSGTASSSSSQHAHWSAKESTGDLRGRAFSVDSSASSSGVTTPFHHLFSNDQQPPAAMPSSLYSYSPTQDLPMDYYFQHQPPTGMDSPGDQHQPLPSDTLSTSFRTRASRSASAPGPSMLSLMEYSSSAVQGLAYDHVQPLQHIDPGLVLGKAAVVGDGIEDDMSQQSDEEDTHGRDESEIETDDEGSTPKSRGTTAGDVMNEDVEDDSEDGASDDHGLVIKSEEEDATFSPPGSQRTRARQSGRQNGAGARASAGQDPDKAALWFPGKVYAMAMAPDSRPHLDWSTDGTSLIIPDPDGAFASEVLGRYFKHDRLSSFLRQLNIYGFSRTRPLGPDGSKKVLEVAHPLFRKDRPDLLEGVVRKTTKASRAKRKAARVSASASTSVSTESPVVSPVPTISVITPEASLLASEAASPLPEVVPSPEPIETFEPDEPVVDSSADLEKANLTINALQDRLREAARTNGEMEVTIQRLLSFLINSVPREKIVAELSDLFPPPAAAPPIVTRPPPTSAPPSQLRFNIGTHLSPSHLHARNMPALSAPHSSTALLSPTSHRHSLAQDEPASPGKKRRLAPQSAVIEPGPSPGSERTPTGTAHPYASSTRPLPRVAATKGSAAKMGSVGASSLAARRRGTRAGSTRIKVEEADEEEYVPAGGGRTRG